MNKKFFRSDKGSITVYVLVALLFILAIVFGRYLLANRQLQTQLNALKQMKTAYESDVREYNNGSTQPPEISPSAGPGTGGGDIGEGDIAVELDTSTVIPIYNYETLKYFLDGNTDPYYIYQTGKKYVYDTNKTFKLMADIEITKFASDIIAYTASYWGGTYSFINEFAVLNNGRLDFNGHVIYSNNGNVYYYYNGQIRQK